jgi:hypothetical protein
MILSFFGDGLRVAALLRAMNLTPAEDIFHDLISAQPHLDTDGFRDKWDAAQEWLSEEYQAAPKS